MIGRFGRTAQARRRLRRLEKLECSGVGRRNSFVVSVSVLSIFVSVTFLSLYVTISFSSNSSYSIERILIIEASIESSRLGGDIYWAKS